MNTKVLILISASIFSSCAFSSGEKDRWDGKGYCPQSVISQITGNVINFSRLYITKDYVQCGYLKYDDTGNLIDGGSFHIQDGFKEYGRSQNSIYRPWPIGYLCESMSNNSKECEFLWKDTGGLNILKNK